ncbi:MAG: DUF5131 family protein [Gammaproteobacteria bacterium]|nr:DUF5131 family protein [Gammaproteobacteria bacterium]
MDRCNTFFILTKHPGRMYDFLMEYEEYQYMENVYFGISAENQHTFDERPAWLVDAPVRFMFMSLEPLLGPVILRHYALFDWCIAGAETGPERRKMDVDWARDIRDGCLKNGMPFFFKQGTGGEETLDGVSHHAMPAVYLE